MAFTPESGEPILSYFLAEKHSILVVSLIGRLVRDGKPVLDKCLQEVQASPAKWVILNFRDVNPDIEKIIVPLLASIQKSIREKPAVLLISSLHPALRKCLEDQGILRPEEVANNLAEALKMLNLAAKPQAA